MRVGLNATCFDNRPSGANQRFRNIYGALIRAHPEIEFFVYEPSDVPIARWFARAPNVVARPTPVPSIGRLARLRAGLGFWRRTLGDDRLDVFEMLHLPLIEAPNCPTVLTIHDLRPILPDQPGPQRLIARTVLHHGFARADRVIAVSDVIREEVKAFHPGAQVTTVYNGVDVDRFRDLDREAARALLAPMGLPDRYMLAVGHLEARKNLPTLVNAVARLRDTGRERPLVIVGNDAGDRDRIVARIAVHRLQSLVTLIGDADDEAVRAINARSHLVVFPSRYEGFGIPILEAMAADRPLVTSDIPVFREIMQDRGSFFPLDDAAAMAEAIDRMWTDDAERERMIDFGRHRVEAFRFPVLAEQVLAVYRSVI